MKKNTKNEVRNFHVAAGAVFSLAGTIHLFSLIFGWDLSLDGWVFPKFISIIAVAVTLYLAHRAFKLA